MSLLRVLVAWAALHALSSLPSHAFAQAGSGLPDPSRPGHGCDQMPASPGQNAPPGNHDNGDPDWKDICACTVGDCSDGPWSSGGGGGVNPALLNPEVRPTADPPPRPDPLPPIICSFADGDPAPYCGSYAEQGVGNRIFDGSAPGYQGWGWFQHSRPELVVDNPDSPGKARIYVGAQRVLDFTLVGGSSPNVFVGNNGVNGVVVRAAGSASAPELYRYYDAHGTVWTFFGYSTNGGQWLNPHGAKGQLWTAANADGNGEVSYTGHATDPQSALANGFVQNGSSQPTARPALVYDSVGRRYTYAYTTLGGWDLLSSITVEVYSGSWTTVWSVEYTYYTSASAGYGLAGDLKMITETIPLSSGGSDVRKAYFRYYTDDGTNGTNDLRHLVKFMVDPEGVRRLGAGNLDSTSDAALKSYSALYYEYDARGKVTKLLTGGGCGCSGSDGLYEFEYTKRTPPDSASMYNASGTDPQSLDWAAGRWAARTIVTYPNGRKQALYFDEMGWLLATVVTNTGGSFSSESNLWITKILRDGRGRPVQIYTPEAIDTSSYNHSSGSIVVKTSAGLVQVIDYYDPGSGNTNYLPFAVAARKVKQGSSGTPTTLETLTYVSPAGSSPPAAKDFGSTNPARLARPLVSLHKRYRSSGLSDDTSFAYTYHGGASSWAPKKRTATLPSLQTGDSSGPGSVTTESYFDSRGRLVLSKDGSGVFSYVKYGGNGLVSKRIADATTGDSDASSDATALGATLPSSGLLYVTTYAYDAQGRLASTTLPSGRVTANHDTKLADGRLVTLVTPSLSGGSASAPVDYTVRNQAGKVEAQGVIAFGGTTSLSGLINTSSSDVIGAVQNGSVASITVNIYDSHGTRLDESRLFNAIPSSYAGASSGQYEKTVYGYDSEGRLRRVADPTGTIARMAHDALGRVVQRKVGTNDAGEPGSPMSGTSNMVAVETVVYDGGGVGNGRVTSRTQHPTASSGDDRTTTYTYDYRGRVLLQVNPLSPHHAFKYDDAGHMLAVGGYSSSPGVVDPTTSASNRVSLVETVYNSRGQVRQTIRHKIDQGDGSSADTLTESRWYDAAGRTIKVQGEQLAKTFYDALGRATHTFTLAAHNDASYGDAAGVGGDTVVEERQHLYDNASKTGNHLMTVEIDRHPLDASTTGALDSAGDGIDVVAVGSIGGRVQITSYYYDSLDRPAAAVALGNNGGATYTRTSDGTVGTRSPARLITSTTYNNDGTVLSTTDPRGIESRSAYDAAGRVVRTIANYADGTPGGGTNGDQD